MSYFLARTTPALILILLVRYILPASFYTAATLILCGLIIALILGRRRSKDAQR